MENYELDGQAMEEQPQDAVEQPEEREQTIVVTETEEEELHQQEMPDDVNPQEEESPEEPVEHTCFQVYTEEPKPQQAPVAPAQPKKKKNAVFWVLAVLLVISLLIQSIGLLSGSKGELTGAAINEKGELILSYADGSNQNLGVVVGQDGTDGADGTTTVIGSGDASTVAINNGLRSSVSIFSTFTQQSWHGSSTAAYSAGSGVIYRLDKEKGNAFIITNYHVVYDGSAKKNGGIAEDISVYLYGSEINGMEMKATYVGGSMYYDLAVLYIEDSAVLRNSNATAVSIADSDTVQVGSKAIAIGNAEGSGISATSGVVSVASEYITMTASDNMTQVDYRVMRIDTAVNSGNSGGGLFDENGKLIGIVNAKIMDTDVENIGYALPSSMVMAVADNIIDYCFGTDCVSVMRPMMGVMVQTTASRAVYDEATGTLTIVETVEIVDVNASQIGAIFQVGDVLVSARLNGREKQLTRQYHVIDLMLTARVGDAVEFTVLRDGVETELSLTVTEGCLTAY